MGDKIKKHPFPGDHPWKECDERSLMCIWHLDYLSTLTLYGACKKRPVNEALMDKAMDERAELSLHLESDAVGIMLADEHEEEETGEVGQT